MKDKLYILGFTLAITAFFVLIVAGLNTLLKDRIAANRDARGKRVVLSLVTTESLDARNAEAIQRAFDEKIIAVPPLPQTNDARLAERENPIYRYYHPAGESSGRVIIPIDGMGFWDKISGFMLLDLNDNTVRGLAFLEQKETPGLGARIEEDEWRAQWVGKRFDQPDTAKRRLRVVPTGSARADEPEIDAITGATETSRAMEKLVNASIERFLTTTAAQPTTAREEFQKDKDGRVLVH